MANMHDTYEFLKLLAVNNNREWFNANKAEYQELRKAWENDIFLLSHQYFCNMILYIPHCKADKLIYQKKNQPAPYKYSSVCSPHFSDYLLYNKLCFFSTVYLT